jgi:hypothetical protein
MPFAAHGVQIAVADAAEQDLMATSLGPGSLRSMQTKRVAADWAAKVLVCMQNSGNGAESVLKQIRQELALLKGLRRFVRIYAARLTQSGNKITTRRSW